MAQCNRYSKVKQITTKKGKTYGRIVSAKEGEDGALRCPGKVIVYYISIKSGGCWDEDDLRIEYRCNQCGTMQSPQGYPTNKTELEKFLREAMA